jgi:hypothetical protein
MAMSAKKTTAKKTATKKRDPSPAAGVAADVAEMVGGAIDVLEASAPAQRSNNCSRARRSLHDALRCLKREV